MTYEKYTKDKWEKKYGKITIEGGAILPFDLEKGERIYKSWVTSFDYGPLVMIKILSIINREEKVKFAVVFEYLDKMKKGYKSDWISTEKYEEIAKGLMEGIPTENPWEEVKISVKEN